MGCAETCLDEVLALRLGDQGLELGGGEGVDEAGLGHDEKQDLCASEGGELVGLEEKARDEEGDEDGLGKEERGD